ncbi:MAG: hypothetical protein OEX12_05880 [Gammaproteobacteria bacterium]|nr:hypothetical protein [Gammaproteobacteria bacterium]
MTTKDHIIKLEEAGQIIEEPTYPPGLNAYPIDGDEWLERQQKDDLNYQMENEDANINP